MAEPYVGEIRMFAGNFAPSGWAFCDGSTLSIAEYEVLFVLIGTTYGGNGQTTFNLPDLRSRVPIHAGTSSVGTPRIIGQTGGSETVTLTTTQLPNHNHILTVANNGTVTDPKGNLLANTTSLQQFTVNSPTGQMNPGVVGPSGGGQPHDNLMPYQSVNFIISLFGIFPSQS